MTPTEFRCLLVDTISRASLPPAQLHHESHLYKWARARCSSRPQRASAPTDAFTVHIDMDFGAFWCTVIADSQLHGARRPQCKDRHPIAGTNHTAVSASYPNRTWINPSLLAQSPEQAPPALSATLSTPIDRPCPSPDRPCPLPARGPDTPLPAIAYTLTFVDVNAGGSPQSMRSLQRGSRQTDAERISGLRQKGTPTRVDETRSREPASSSHLVTVKWVHPAESNRHLIERLRDAGLFIPAGTHVYAGYGRVRVLGLPDRQAMDRLLHTKGGILRNRKDISINPARTSRRLSYSERRAIQACTLSDTN